MCVRACMLANIDKIMHKYIRMTTVTHVSRSSDIWPVVYEVVTLIRQKHDKPPHIVSSNTHIYTCVYIYMYMLLCHGRQ